MNKTTYFCEAVTPMFVYGATSLELRAASLKGLLRYWWRALNGHLPMKKLRKREGWLFGSSDEKAGRSPIMLRIIPGKMKTGHEFLLPHKEKASIEAYTVGSQFQVAVVSLGTPDEHARYEAVVEAALLLGGLGRRVRRGFGSVAITAKENTKANGNDNNENATLCIAPHDLQAISVLLNSVNSERFNIQGGKITSHGFAGEYPYLKTVELGRAYNSAQDLLVQIGLATHSVSRGGSDYTGFSRGQRKLASPVYVTVLRIGTSFHPLITTLNTVFDSKHVPRGTDKQAVLKGAIL